MAKELPCNGGACPDIDPATGRFKGTSTVRATVEGTPQAVTVQKDDLMTAARNVRTHALLSGVGVGERVRDQARSVSATTMQGQAVTAEIGGATLTSEARQARAAQMRDAATLVFQGARKAFGSRAPRPARA